MMAANLEIISTPLSDVGLQRSGNEDSCLIAEPNLPQMLVDSGRLYIVADGVGGAAYGERASRLAVETVQREYYRHTTLEPGERLRRAIEAANRSVYEEAHRSGGRRMATTMVAAAVLNGYLSVAWVGDSRAYLIRNGTPMQITEDHTLVQQMVRRGEMTEAEAEVSSIRNRLLRSVGGDEDVLVDVIAQDIPLQAGDTLVLCTDGLTKYADGEQIARLIDEHPDESAQRLVDFALRSGGADNITVIVARVVSDRLGSQGVMIPSAPAPAGSAAALDEELIETQGISGKDRRIAGVRRRRTPQIPPALEKVWDGLGRKVHWLILISLVCVVLAAGTTLGGMLLRGWTVQARNMTAHPIKKTIVAMNATATTSTESIPIIGAESETPLPAMTTAIPPVIETPPVVPTMVEPLATTAVPPVDPVATTSIPSEPPAIATVTPLEPENQLPKPTDVVVPRSPQTGMRVCVQQVKNGIALENMLKSDAVSRKNYERYKFYYFESDGCVKENQVAACTGRWERLENIGKLDVGWWIFTTDYPNPNDCPFLEGIWIPSLP